MSCARSLRILRAVHWLFITDVSGHPIGPIFTVNQSKDFPKRRKHTTNLCRLKSQTPDGSATPRKTPEFSYDAQPLGPCSQRFRRHQFSKHDKPLTQQHSLVSPKTGILRDDTARTTNLTSELMLEMSCYLTLNLRHARLHPSYKKRLTLRNKRCDTDDTVSHLRNSS